MTYKGVSGFAIMNKNFPIKRFLKQYPNDLDKPFLPILFNFFGRNWNGIDQFLEEFGDRPHLLEFHLCFRNPDPDMADHARRIVRQMEKRQNDNTTVLIDPILEDVCRNTDEWKQWARNVRKQVPYKLVRCSLKSRAAGGAYQEYHGNNPRFTRQPKRCIANPDGLSINFNDNENYHNTMSVSQAKTYLQTYKNVYAIALWSANQQGLGKQQGWSSTNPAPEHRNYIVTDEAINGMRQLLKSI